MLSAALFHAAGPARLAGLARCFGAQTQKGPVFEVLRIVAGGHEYPMLWDVTHAELGLPLRDAKFFTRTDFCVPPAALLWRKNALYLRLEPFMAVVRPSEVLIFEPRRGAVVCAANDAAAQAASPAFALAVLDVLLSRAVNHSRHKLTRLCSAVDCALDDISAALRGGSASGEAFARLVPLTRALAALASDVAEVQEALQSLARDPQALSALGAGAAEVSDAEPGWEAFEERYTVARGTRRLKAPTGDDAEDDDDAESAESGAEAAALETKSMIGTYLRQVLAIGGELRELRQHIAATREVWELQLDGARNRLHKIELKLNVLMLSLSVAVVRRTDVPPAICATPALLCFGTEGHQILKASVASQVPASLLGMNLPHGLEEQQGAFAVVTAACGLGSAAACAAGILWARSTGPAEAMEARDGASAARALAAVLSSLDEIEEALRSKGGALSKEELMEELRRTCPGRFDTADGAELRLLYRMFDSDSNERLTIAEWESETPLSPHGALHGIQRHAGDQTSGVDATRAAADKKRGPRQQPPPPRGGGGGGGTPSGAGGGGISSSHFLTGS